MVSIIGIRQKAEKWYGDFLVAVLQSAPFFPKYVPTENGKKLSVLERNTAYENLVLKSKLHLNYGYNVTFKKIRKKGQGSIPIPILDKIFFENEQDYLKYIGKLKDFELFKKLVQLIRQRAPNLENWLYMNVLCITELSDKWDVLLNICDYFLNDYDVERPKFMRELPIEGIDTKFIEQNKKIITELLNVVLPPEKINTTATSIKAFEKRFYLKETDPFVSIRSLDTAIRFDLYSELQVRVSELAAQPIECKKVFIVENQTNYRSFPSLPFSIILFGKGYAVDILKTVEWLRNKQIYYWGDIDTNGFHILSILRHFLPHTQSFLMDLSVFNAPHYQFLKSIESKPKLEFPKQLNEAEIMVYQYLLTQVFPNKNRLEQDRISLTDVISYLAANHSL